MQGSTTHQKNAWNFFLMYITNFLKTNPCTSNIAQHFRRNSNCNVWDTFMDQHIIMGRESGCLWRWLAHSRTGRSSMQVTTALSELGNHNINNNSAVHATRCLVWPPAQTVRTAQCQNWQDHQHRKQSWFLSCWWCVRGRGPYWVSNRQIVPYLRTRGEVPWQLTPHRTVHITQHSFFRSESKSSSRSRVSGVLPAILGMYCCWHKPSRS